MSGLHSSLTLRPAQADDEEFLLRVYASTREQELAMTGWDAAQREAFVKMQMAAQQAHYQSHYPMGEHHVIVSDGRPVGRLYVARQEGEIRILDITLLPEHRGQGVGTPLIEGLMAEAAQSGVPLRIYVETYNRSLGLFERLGFRRVKDDGLNILLECLPPSSASRGG